jgi:DNA mismatch repair ATPase MutL
MKAAACRENAVQLFDARPDITMSTTNGDSSSSRRTSSSTAGSSTAGSTTRPKIRPLPKDVVDRIAAGEVVQRPVSVVKELLENSLDADSTQIDISCQRGGLDSITVTDDGFGIHPRDLPLACTRFATSKLVSVEDLKSIRTFGFRGEALASASMVARVTITSRVRPKRSRNNKTNAKNYSNATSSLLANYQKKNDGDDSSNDDDDDDIPHSNCAFKMQYKDGSHCSTYIPNGNARPSAGREGTVILVQDLFYNIPSRRRALEGRKNEREEYERTLGVTQRYAIHEAKRGVGFLCRDKTLGKNKIGNTNNADLNTQSLASIKKLQNERKRMRSVVTATTTTTTQSSMSSSSLEEDQLAATKDVIGHVFGTAVSRELLPFKAGEGDVEAVSALALKAMMTMEENNKNGSSSSSAATMESSAESNELLAEMMMSEESSNAPNNNSSSTTATQSSTTSKFAFAYRATGLITNGSYTAPKSSAAFILFINDRLVESSSLRRAVESIYSDTLPKGGKPFVYISLELPGPHIDVNVHPTKREVAFLHEDRLCDAVAAAVRECIGSATASRTFEVKKSGALFTETKNSGFAAAAAATMTSKKSSTDLTSSSSLSGKSGIDVGSDEREEDKDEEKEDEVEQGESNTDNSTKSVEKTPRKRLAEASKSSSTAKKPYDPSRLVRTNRAAPAGAMEAFLYKKETVAASGKSSKGSDHVHPTTNEQTTQHEPGCPQYGKAQMDLSVPGAFASAICRCQVQRSESLPPASNSVVVRGAANNKVIPKKIIPSECDYESICNLRNEIANQNHQELNETLRGSTFVGAVSRSRSLIQCGVDLLIINHRELAIEMFYQVALMKFNEMPMAKLGENGVDVMSVIGQRLQVEDIADSIDANEDTEKLLLSKVSSANAKLACEVVKCLTEKAPMLEEYFSIKFEKRKVSKQQRQVTALFITGLPILLAGHLPQPHALPLFLIRLATEVDWSEEQPCFKGVCRELASFYAEPPIASTNDEESEKSESPDLFIDDEAKQYVRHTLFPAISYLLVPPQKLASNGTAVKLANLNSLYKVFERC